MSWTWSPVRVLGRTFRLVGAGWLCSCCGCGLPAGGAGAWATVSTAAANSAIVADRDIDDSFKPKISSWAGMSQNSLSDGRILHNRDAFAGQGSRAGDTVVTRQRKAERQIDRVADSDARCNQHLGDHEAVVAQLQRRGGIEQVKAVVQSSRQAKGLAEVARTGGKT